MYSAAELLRWKPGQLKGLLSDLGMDASGCAEKRDIVEKIFQHPGGLEAAAKAAAARGDAVPQPAGQGAEEGSASVEGGRGGDPLAAQQGELASLRGMSMSALKVVGSAEGAGSDGFLNEQDLAARIDDTRKQSSTAAPKPDADEREEADGNLVGMTLADYMSRPPEEVKEAERGRSRGRPAVRGAVEGHVDRTASGSAHGGRQDGSLASSGGRRVVRLAPAGIAPPSKPAPEWVLDMQVCAVSMFCAHSESAPS